MENGAATLELPEGEAALGNVRVANEVVAWIVAYAALDVQGVAALYRPGGQSIDRILRRPAAHRGVKVSLLDNDTLQIDCWIAMDAGCNAPAVGAEVQAQVADAIDRMLGMRLAAVNVYVSEVVFT
jgi:uncharacterized alkaline shock family protein YloU